MEILSKVASVFTDPEGKIVQNNTTVGSSDNASDAVKQKDSSVVSHIGEKIVFDELSLKSSFNGAKINLIGKYQSMVIYESLTSHSISGSISISDTEGLLEKFLIIGGEELTIKISKPITNELLIWREDLVVHKMASSDVDETSLNSTFTLQFTTKTFIRSLKKRYFGVFKGKKFNDAVGDIFSEVSDNAVILNDPALSFTELKPFISTGIAPLNLISDLAKKACSKGEYFIFFERLIPVTNQELKLAASHYFGSLQTLINNAQDNIYTITFQPKLSGYIENNLGANVIRTAKYTKLSNFNHIDAMLTGLYNTKITSLNLTGRDYSVDKISYATENINGDFYNSRTLSTQTIFGIYNDLKNEMPGEKLIISSEHNHSFPKSKWLKRHLYGQITSNLFKIQVVIEGGTNRISAGSIVQFKVPSHFKKILNPTLSKIDDDVLQSGKYVVTSVRHDFRNDTYSKTIELSRGSLNLNHSSITPSNTSQTVLNDNKSISITKKTSTVNFNSTYTASSKTEPSLSSVIPNVINTTLRIKFIGISTSIKRNDLGVLDSASTEILRGIGIRLFGDTVPSSSNIETNIASVFSNILKRSPTSSEISYWSDQIKTKDVSIASMQSKIAASEESILKYKTNPLKLYTDSSLSLIAKSITNRDWNNLNTAIITLYPDNVNALTEEILTINRERLQAKL